MLRKDGTSIEIDYLVTYIFMDDIIIMCGQYIKLPEFIPKIQEVDLIFSYDNNE